MGGLIDEKRKMSKTILSSTIEINEMSSYDYESAIAKTGYGKYNIQLLALMVFPIMSSIFSTTVISLILPSAECELQLTDFKKGLLNAVTFSGMIISSFFWGFLSDTTGRQKLLVTAYALDAIFNILAGLAQSYTFLLVSKLFVGLICSGFYPIATTYLAECHAEKYRATVIQWSGSFSALATIFLPLLAWVILPQQININIFNYLYIPSWRLYMLLCSVPSILSSIIFYFLDESPKFLSAQGRNEEALMALRKMYVTNTGKLPSTFPVLQIIQENKFVSENEKSSIFNFIKAGWTQIKPLFLHPHLRPASLVFLFQFGAMFGYNTIRLWMPQLFSSIITVETTMGNNSTSFKTICHLLDTLNETQVTVTNGTNLISCGEIFVDDKVYINSVIIGVISFVGFLGSGTLASYLGDKGLILWSTAGAIACCLAMFWAVTSDVMLILSSLFVAATSISSTAIISMAVKLFPTETRSMAVCLTLMCGQIGGIVGNLMFPLLLNWNCQAPFFILAAIIFGTGVITLVIPNTK